MDLVEYEAFSFFKQQIVRLICHYSSQLGLQPLSRPVVDSLVQYLSVVVPVRNANLRILVIRLAFSIHLAEHQAQVSGFPHLCQVTPQ